MLSVGFGITEKLTLMVAVHTPLKPVRVAVAGPLLYGGKLDTGEAGPEGLTLEI